MGLASQNRKFQNDIILGKSPCFWGTFIFCVMQYRPISPNLCMHKSLIFSAVDYIQSYTPMTAF